MTENNIDRVLGLLDAMAETWVEKNGIEQQIRHIPVNMPTDEFSERTYALILRFVKLAYVEGLYVGRNSINAGVRRKK